MSHVTKAFLLCALIASTCNCSATQVNDKVLFLRSGNTLGSGFSPSQWQASRGGDIKGNPKVISGGCYLTVCESNRSGDLFGICSGKKFDSTDFALTASTPLFTTAPLGRPSGSYGVHGWVCKWTRVANKQPNLYVEAHVVLLTDGKA
jgi:hypothetical protein